MGVQQQGRLAVLLACAASIGWSALVVTGGLWFPAVTTVSRLCHEAVSEGSTRCVQGVVDTSSMVEAQGAWVLALLAVPLAVAAAVTALLWHSPSPYRPASATAWGLVALLWLISLLVGFSGGLFLVPVAALLTIAAVLAREPATPALAS